MNNLAVQQIMIGSACKDEKTTLSTLKRIKQVGYDGIELNLFMIEDTPLIVRLLTKMAGMPVGKGANIYIGPLTNRHPCHFCKQSNYKWRVLNHK